MTRSLRRTIRAVILAGGVTSCDAGFVSDPPVTIAILQRGTWPQVMTAGDALVLEIRGVHADLGEIDAPRATWRSSNENILRVSPVPMRGTSDSAQVDTLSARRTRILVTAVGSGTATLTVVLDTPDGIAATEQSFSIQVAPLALQRLGTRVTFAAAQVDTVQVVVRRSGGDSTTAHRLTWRSSDETVARIEPLAATSASEYANTLVTNRLKVRLVALRAGSASITAQLEPSVTMLEVRELTFAVNVQALRLERVGSRTAYGIAESDTLRVRVLGIGNDSTTAHRLTWRSTNDNIVRIESVSPGSAGDAEAIQATNRLKVRLVALRNGSATITAAIEATAGTAESTELAFAVTVAPLTVQKLTGRASLSVAESDVYQVDLRNAAGGSGPPVNLAWRTVPDGIVRVEPLPSSTGVVADDSLAARGYRVRLVAIAAGSATVTAAVIPGTNVLEALEGAFAVSVGAARIVNNGAVSIDTVSLSDTTVFGVKVLNQAGDTIPGTRLTWQSSDEQLVRIEPVPLIGSPADSLSARRLQMRAIALRRGVVQLTARLERGGVPLSGSEVVFTTRVAPLTLSPVAWPAAVTVSDQAALEVNVRDFRGVRRTDKVLRWLTSDAARLTLSSIAPSGGPDDNLLARRHRMSSQARASGTVTLTVGLETTGGVDAADTTFTIPVRPLVLSVVKSADTVAVSQADTITVSLTSAAGGSFDNLRLTWRSSDESTLRVEPLGFTGNATLDSLASRRLRFRVVGVLRGTVDVIGTVEGSAGLEVPERRIAVTVLPLQLNTVGWPDTMSVADMASLQVHVTDSRGRAVQGLSVLWSSSADSSLALTGPGLAGRGAGASRIEAVRAGARQAVAAPRLASAAISSAVPTTAAVSAAALYRDSVRVTLRIEGVAASENALMTRPIRIMERWVDVAVGFESTCALAFDGRAYCFGRRPGQVGYTVPAQLASAYTGNTIRFGRLIGAARTYCGESATTAQLWSCWGDNQPGLIGGAPKLFQSFALPLWPGVFTARELALGGGLACGLATGYYAIQDIEVTFCWNGASVSPVPVPCGGSINGCAHPLNDAAEVSVGGMFACAAGPRTRGRFLNLSSFEPGEDVWCWSLAPGSMAKPVQRDGAPLPSSVPEGTHGLATSQAAGCGLVSGQTWCWGTPFAPDVVLPGGQTTPAAVQVHPAYVFQELAASPDIPDLCGVTPAGAAYCWTDASAITPEAPALRIMRLRFALDHRCAITAPAGALYCWGVNNDCGQFGNSTQHASFTPIRVSEPPSLPPALRICAGVG